MYINTKILVVPAALKIYSFEHQFPLLALWVLMRHADTMQGLYRALGNAQLEPIMGILFWRICLAAKSPPLCNVAPWFPPLFCVRRAFCSPLRPSPFPARSTPLTH
jgi:hypothetical protein